MKKVILMLIFSLVFFACGKEKSDVVYRVGTNAEYPPYEYIEDGKIVGFDPDIMEELSKRVGFKYEWVNMNFDGLISALQSKKVDMVIAGMTSNEERKKYVKFSTPYIKPAICIVSLNKNKGKNLDYFNDKKFGVELGTTEEGIVKKEFPNAEIIPFSGHTAALIALKAEKIDAILLDSKVADNYEKNNPEITVIGDVTGEEKAMAFNLEDKELYQKVNSALEAMIKDGTIEKLKEKYDI